MKDSIQVSETTFARTIKEIFDDTETWELLGVSKVLLYTPQIIRELKNTNSMLYKDLYAYCLIKQIYEMLSYQKLSELLREIIEIKEGLSIDIEDDDDDIDEEEMRTPQSIQEQQTAIARIYEEIKSCGAQEIKLHRELATKIKDVIQQKQKLLVEQQKPLLKALKETLDEMPVIKYVLEEERDDKTREIQRKREEREWLEDIYESNKYLLEDPKKPEVQKEIQQRAEREEKVKKLILSGQTENTGLPEAVFEQKKAIHTELINTVIHKRLSEALLKKNKINFTQNEEALAKIDEDNFEAIGKIKHEIETNHKNTADRLEEFEKITGRPLKSKPNLLHEMHVTYAKDPVTRYHLSKAVTPKEPHEQKRPGDEISKRPQEKPASKV